MYRPTSDLGMWAPSAEQTFARPDNRTLECLTCGRLDFTASAHLIHVESHGESVETLGVWNS